MAQQNLDRTRLEQKNNPHRMLKKFVQQGRSE
jgi:hypothetical protein